MNKENNMDKFLRGSLDNLEVQPSRNVWKSISKRLLILEVVRLNFTNVGKFWLYSGLATLTTIAGISYFSLSNNSDTPLEEKSIQSEILVETSSDKSENSKTTKYTQDPIDEKKIEPTSKQTLKQDDPVSLPTPAAETKSSKTKPDNQQILVSEVKNKTVIRSPEEENKEVTQVFNATDKELNEQQQSVIQSKKAEKPTEIAIAVQLSEEEITEEHQGEYSTNDVSTNEPIIIASSSLTNDSIADDVSEQKVSNATSENSKNTKLNWWASINYMHSWPMKNTQYLPQANLFAIKGGVNYNRWDFSIGLGLQSDETNAEYEFLYNSIDSVGFFYDIDYYEIIPDNPDSIIIHYTVVAVSDTVEHSLVEKTTQNSRWVMIPIEIGYEVIKKKAFILKANVSARIGWEYYREVMETKLLPGFNSSYQKIGAESVSPHINIGIGLENQIRIYDKWWFIIEPQVYYNVKTPYKWDGSKGSGPFGFGVNTGIKYKF